MSYTDYNTSICFEERTTTEGDLNSIHLKFCKLQVWGRYVSTPKVSSFLNSYLVLNWCMSSHLALKKMRGVSMVTTLSSSTKYHGKCSQCPAFDIKQSPAGRSPEDHQVRAHAYLSLNKAQSCFMLPLSVLVYMLWFECMTQHIHS